MSTPSTLLKTYGLRVTKDRERILGLFLEDRCWSAGQLHMALNPLDLSTVYRNIQSLQENGLIEEMHAHQQEKFFELSHRARTHHDHNLCGNCQKMVCIPCPVTSLPEHHLEINVLCVECA